MDYTLIRAVAGNERLVIISETLFDQIVDLANQNLGDANMGDWVNSRTNRNCLPIALAERLLRQTVTDDVETVD